MEFEILFKGAMALLMFLLYFCILALFVRLLSGMVMSMLRAVFGKKSATDAVTEPGQSLKKVKKAKALPASVASLVDEPDAEDMSDVVDSEEGQRPAVSQAQSSELADRLADEFEAHQVSSC